jgi:hypothetical protein
MTDRRHVQLMLVAAAGTVAYWTAWFAGGAVATSGDPCYVAFENAFPAADGYMAAAFVVAALQLRRRGALAVPAGIAAGSAMVFLGLMDTLYNLEHGKYADATVEMALEALINVVCLTFGPYTMWRLWAARTRLDV